MCFVMRLLHYAIHILNVLYDEKIVFDFKTFPQLKTVFRELKVDLNTLVTVDTIPN
jgi:hypothetical protein